MEESADELKIKAQLFNKRAIEVKNLARSWSLWMKLVIIAVCCLLLYLLWRWLF